MITIKRQDKVEIGDGVLYRGDAMKLLKELPDNYIDTLITDPPYGLANHLETVIVNVVSNWVNGNDGYIPKGKGFMGASWDTFVPPPAFWKEVCRVLKPGATALVFAGTKTQDLMTMSMRLAGFEIKDVIMWLYGSGMPKALNISKQIDKKAGKKRKVVGYKKLNPNDKKVYIPNSESVFTKGQKDKGIKAQQITAPATSEAKRWLGWMSHSLKPAYEPIICAIKKNSNNYVENALKWGVSGLWCDGGRVGFEEISVHDAPVGTFAGGERDRGSIKNYRSHRGRFPSNIILECICDSMIIEPTEVKELEDVKDGMQIHTNPECPCYMLDKQSGNLKRAGNKKPMSHKNWTSKFGIGNIEVNPAIPGDNGGGASRFFYQAKASKNEKHMGCEELYWLDGKLIDKELWLKLERENLENEGNKDFKKHNLQKGNIHQTVKPIKLMEYLCKLTMTPSGGVVLDPFLGSGTTAIACVNTGRRFIGIEKEPDYFEIAKARITDAVRRKHVQLF